MADPRLLHLDTDIGGDPDDVAAMAMLLARPDVEITGVTTTIDPGGARAGYARHVLALAGRADVPVVAGAEASWTRGEPAYPFADRRYWPSDVPAAPAPDGAALDLLSASLERGATVVAIGPQTNLARLEQARPGALARASVVVMGGWVRPLDEDLPPWGPDRDWNVQWDTLAAAVVARAAGDLTLVTLADTLRTHLRARDLPRLRSAGPLGALLAAQAVAYAADRDHASLAAAHEGLPGDLLLFLHDPLACAVALGWEGCRTETRSLSPVITGGVLSFREAADGRPVRVVAEVDAAGVRAGGWRQSRQCARHLLYGVDDGRRDLVALFPSGARLDRRAHGRRRAGVPSRPSRVRTHAAGACRSARSRAWRRAGAGKGRVGTTWSSGLQGARRLVGLPAGAREAAGLDPGDRHRREPRPRGGPHGLSLRSRCDRLRARS